MVMKINSINSHDKISMRYIKESNIIELVIIIVFLILSPLTFAEPQEVVVADFPYGVAASVAPDFFLPYHSQLQALADTLAKYPLALAVVTGGADGGRYGENNDAKNPGLALGRAHALRNVLVRQFNVDSARIIIQSGDVEVRGGPYRYASVRIAWELSDLEARLDSLANQPPVEKHVTEVKEISNNLSENMSLQLGLGFSSSPFGGIPLAAAAIAWKRFLFIEGIAGYTLWNKSFGYEGVNLRTRLRLAGAQITLYPLAKVPVGVTGGWMRIEQISQRYYEYVKMSEGPALGLRFRPSDYFLITGLYNPAKHDIFGNSKSILRNNQFLFAAMACLRFGGGR
jgi:hypothetical protein